MGLLNLDLAVRSLAGPADAGLCGLSLHSGPPRRKGLSAYSVLPSAHPAPNHLMGMLIALSAIAASASFRASPYNRRLAAPSRRTGFVNLRATHSPPVAPHPVSRRKSANHARATGERRSYSRIHKGSLHAAGTYPPLTRRSHGRTIASLRSQSPRRGAGRQRLRHRGGRRAGLDLSFS